MKKNSETAQIQELLKELHLPAMRENFEQKISEALQEQSGYLTFLR